MNFTDEQQNVIDARGCNVLVSAAAGSGKTAVLVERIIQLITDENAVDIDHLLVVTFTRAAAAQMKERVTQAIEERLSADPGNSHLQRQETLIHNALITTIDSFCQYVIRNNFNEIDLDPSYRVGDEGEIRLLRNDVIKELLEEKYAEGSEEFLFCSEYFSTGNSDKALEEQILQLYGFAMSMPWPQDWLQERMKDYDLTAENFDQAPWVQQCLQQSAETLMECAGQLESAIRICEQPDGPYMYAELLEEEAGMLTRLSAKKNFAEMQQGFGAVSYGRLSAKKDDAVSPGKREMVKDIRGRVKKTVAGLQEHFFAEDMDTVLRHMQLCARAVHEICALTLDFKTAFDKRKADQNIIDFTDMEHFALNILVQHEPGQPAEEAVPTQAALEYRDFFAEILIDEYQDSNMVQELILKAIAKDEKAQSDRFMVGDVKQSIYRFRLARPEIFMEKLDRYERADAAQNRRIDLHRNFRSRRSVLDGVNAVFEKVMGRDLGGVEYDADARLQAGAAFPEAEDPAAYATELVMIRTDADDAEEDSTEDAAESAAPWGLEEAAPGRKLNAKQQEAMVIASRIRELLTDGRISDGKGGMREVHYRDIVILLRATTGWDDTFRKILESEGIPAYVESKTGYFKAPEVSILLQLLSVLDNPLQDIPLVSVMHSCIGDFSDEELAVIKAEGAEKAAKTPDGRFYDILTAFVQEKMETQEQNQEPQQEQKKAQESGDTVLQCKVRDFLKMLADWREHTVYLPVHELLQYILSASGYLEYVTAMPGGTRRRANVEMLLEKAAEFERTSFKGLFHFVRYIEQLEKYEVDYGEANVLDENADVVRIMSIHKSKGLEFPVVFVAGLSKKFNTRDTAGTLITDVDLGIGVNCVDAELRVQYGTLRKSIIAEKMRTDSLGEELRVLYVAMTRAKEKLILTAAVSKLENQITALLPLLLSEEEQKLIPLGIRSSASSYFGILLMALIRNPGFRQVAQDCGIDMSMIPEHSETDDINLFRFRTVNSQDIHAGMIREEMRASAREQILSKPLTEEVIDTGLQQSMRKRFLFTYAHENYQKLYTKTTVTELKKAVLEEQEESSFHPFAETKPQAYVPEFIQARGKAQGAERGTAYHKVMELLDGRMLKAQCPSETEIQEWMQQEEENGLMPEGYARIVEPSDVATFIRSRLGQRMAGALAAGSLYREKPFMMGLPADRVDTALPEQELVLIQGIIDAWFVETDDQIVIMDYKTDHVQNGRQLADRYHVQLEYYQEALEKITGKKVKEKIIYSFALGEEIRLS